MLAEYSYRFWEPNQGLEEQQAEVFNEANECKFQPANTDQIKKQYKKLKIDPKHVRYAFREEKMVGYIQVRIQKKTKEIVLSYPWTIPDTDTEVRKTLFDGMMKYLRNQDRNRDMERINLFCLY